MHALIVVTPTLEDAPPSRTGARISIFPGSASPAMHPARTPFWIGYGFTAERPPRPDVRALDTDTRFELLLGGERVELVLELELELEKGTPVSKFEVASFPDGLEAGWHRFVGRWYDEGALVLTSDKTIQFVE